MRSGRRGTKGGGKRREGGVLSKGREEEGRGSTEVHGAVDLGGVTVTEIRGDGSSRDRPVSN